MKFTAKVIHEKIKRNWTAEDFAQNLGISTEEFWKQLEIQFPGNSFKEFKSSINSNEKLHKRHKNHDDTSEPIATSEVAISATEGYSTDEYVDDANVVDSPTVAPAEPNSETPTPTPTLEELTSNLEVILFNLNEEELIHKDIVAKRIAIKKQIESHQADLLEIKATIAKHEADIKTILSELNDTQTQLTDSTAKIQLLQREKDEIEAQIERSKKVYIFVYDTGEIDVDTQSAIELPEGNDLFTEIVGDEELESLTIKETKALARVIVLVRSLIEQGRPYEVSFDQSIAESYFKKAIN